MLDIQNFYVFTSAFAISQILLVLAKILSHKNLHTSELLFSSFLICIGIYLTQPLFLDQQHNNLRFIETIWRHLPTAIPALFLFCCMAIFQDNLKLKASYSLPLLLTLLPPFIFDALSLQGRVLHLLMLTLPQGLEFILLAFGLWIVATSWRNDLIERRRKFRLLVMGCAGSIIFVVIIAQQLTSISPQQIDLLHYPIACLFLVCFNIFLLDINTDIILSQYKPSLPQKEINKELTPPTEELSPELNYLLSHIEEKKLYQETSLTITQLAYQIDKPEYKIRKLINQELGYRNFNEFLNHYRIQEACSLLSKTDESVTHIAHQVGYNAISAFNRAFKEAHEQTPSAFRKNSKKG